MSPLLYDTFNRDLAKRDGGPNAVGREYIVKFSRELVEYCGAVKNLSPTPPETLEISGLFVVLYILTRIIYSLPS